jgi:hypothetical protein
LQRPTSALVLLQATVENSKWREEQARTLYQEQQRRERQEIEDRYERECVVYERRIEKVFEMGRIPDPEG